MRITWGEKVEKNDLFFQNFVQNLNEKEMSYGFFESIKKFSKERDKIPNFDDCQNFYDFFLFANLIFSILPSNFDDFFQIFVPLQSSQHQKIDFPTFYRFHQKYYSSFPSPTPVDPNVFYQKLLRQHNINISSGLADSSIKNSTGEKTESSPSINTYVKREVISEEREDETRQHIANTTNVSLGEWAWQETQSLGANNANNSNESESLLRETGVNSANSAITSHYRDMASSETRERDANLNASNINNDGDGDGKMRRRQFIYAISLFSVSIGSIFCYFYYHIKNSPTSLPSSKNPSSSPPSTSPPSDSSYRNPRSSPLSPLASPTLSSPISSNATPPDIKNQGDSYSFKNHQIFKTSASSASSPLSPLSPLSPISPLSPLSSIYQLPRRWMRMDPKKNANPLPVFENKNLVYKVKHKFAKANAATTLANKNLYPSPLSSSPLLSKKNIKISSPNNANANLTNALNGKNNENINYSNSANNATNSKHSTASANNTGNATMTNKTGVVPSAGEIGNVTNTGKLGIATIANNRIGINPIPSAMNHFLKKDQKLMRVSFGSQKNANKIKKVDESSLFPVVKKSHQKPNLTKSLHQVLSHSKKNYPYYVNHSLLFFFK